MIDASPFDPCDSCKRFMELIRSKGHEFYFPCYHKKKKTKGKKTLDDVPIV